MGNQKSLEKWSEHELLETPLCDLSLSLEKSFVAPLIGKVTNELRKKNIRFKPHFWVSDEWFCPDGSSGVAIPFYLLNPRLIEMERKYTGEVEGEDSATCLKLLRHEVGHAFENAYGSRRHPMRIHFFGDSSQFKYPKSYRPKIHSRKYVVNLGDGYAQSHPDEDFAETFAVWLNPLSRWRKTYADWPALSKLEVLDRIAREYGVRRPRLKNQKKFDCITNQKVTLKQYFSAKRKRLHRRPQNFYDKELLQIFDPSILNFKGQNAAKFIMSKKSEIAKSVANHVGLKSYQVGYRVDEIAQRSRSMHLVLRRNKTTTKLQILDLVIRETLEDLNSSRDKIFL